jgi:hypothetical protein
MANEIIDQALELATMGIKIHPCDPSDKKAYTSWSKSPTTDPEQIRKWWDTWPDALIGIPCVANGLLAIDVDNKNGKNGTRSWNELVRRYGNGKSTPIGPMQRTPTGGFHLIFKHPPEEISSKVNKLGDGLDIRSKAYICTGPGYMWLEEHDPATPLTDLPDWLIEEIHNLDRKKDTKPSNDYKPVQDSAGVGEYWLSYYLPKAYPGNRNQTCFEMACQLRDSGLNMSEAEKFILEYAHSVPSGDHPYTDQEAISTLKSAYKGQRREAAILPAIADNEPPLDEPSTKADPWQVFTLADAYKDREPVQYVARGLFELPSLNIFYGPPGALKSFLLADLSICVAAGIDWLPPAPWKNGAESFSTNQLPVMWLDFDNGPRRTHERFEALGRARELSPDLPLFYYSMPSPWLNATDKGSIGALSLRAEERLAKFICIDNLGTVTGGADENSNQMVIVMSLFRQLAEDTGAALCLIHHQRKSRITGGRAGDNLRGHSSIEAALDLALVIEREEQSDIVNVRSTKTRGIDVYPFSAAFTYDSKTNGDIASAKFYGLEIEDTSSGFAIEQAIKKALTGNALNKTGLTKAVKEQLLEIGVNRIRDRIDRMAAAKKITTTQGKRTEIIYSLP